MKTDLIRNVVRINLGLAFVEGLFVFWQYVQTQSEAETAVFLGFSPLRLVILLGVFVILAALGYGLSISSRDHWWEGKVGRNLAQFHHRAEVFWFFIAALGVLYFILLSSEHVLGSPAVYRSSLNPILVWLVLISTTALVSFLFLRASDLPILGTFRDVLLPSMVALIALLSLVLFVAATRIGLDPDAVYWQDPGTALLLPQVWVAWVTGTILFYLLGRFKTPSLKKTDLFICFGIWMIASLLWLNQPLTPAYNALEPKEPNFQVYPFGDALLYDVIAHGFLIGQPLESDFWIKPLYSLFLGILHFFSQENYGLLISMQVILLAVIPIFVYLLTAELSNRPAGLVAAMLVILRERNGIALSNVIEVSHSKLLMSDVFTMGLMVLMLWLLIRWIRKPDLHRSAPFVVGALVALLTLTRGHPIVLFPVIGCILLFMAPRPALRWRSILLLTLGLVLPLVPWFWRNYQAMGKLTFQNPVSPYSANVAGLYSMTPLLASPRTFNETDSAYYERLQKQIVRFVVEHPAELVRFVSAHYAHNAIFSYIYLPHSFEIEPVRTYVKTEPFWHQWEGSLSTQGRVLLVLNIIVLSLGLGRAWKDVKWYAFLPIVVGIGYNLSIAVGRLSGWRFILPADWITLMYYAIGLMQVAYLAGYLLSGRTEPASIVEQNLSPAPTTRFSLSMIGLGALFLSLSLLLTYGHKLFTPREAHPTQEQLIGIFQKNSELTQIPAEAVQTFLEQDNAVLLSGQSLYPAFFKPKSGVLNHYWLAFEARPYSRIVFYLMGPKSASVILPVTSRPTAFPDAADVIVLGCMNENNYVDAVSVVITSTQPQIVYNRDPAPSLICPLPEPR
jgi:hypothetical protein